MPHSEFWPFHSNTVTKSEEDVNLSGESSVLQKQLGDMEGEVREIQMELAAIRRDRLDLFNRKQPKGTYDSENNVTKDEVTYELAEVSKDSHTHYSDVLKLREDLIRAKNAADEEKYQREKYEDKLKDIQTKLDSFCCRGLINDVKDPRKMDDDSASVKLQLRDMQDELEELKMTVSEQAEQVQDYRLKYLQAQQEALEYKRQLDIVDFDNKQVSDQIQMEIQKMKMQFQEKLQELSPLPDLLKGAQIQLQEAKQLQKLAEESSQQFSTELHRVKEMLIVAVNNIGQERADKNKALEENKALSASIEEKDRAIEELNKTNEELRCVVLRLEEKLNQQDTRLREKSTECAQLLKDIEEARVENNRSLTRNKERADSMRRYLQTQISELERQLIQSRAQYKACQKDRDEIRQRMQIQINNLQENFELVEIRLRGLQGQVTSLKNSYTVILTDDDDNTDFKLVTS